MGFTRKVLGTGNVKKITTCPFLLFNENMREKKIEYDTEIMIVEPFLEQMRGFYRSLRTHYGMF